MAEPLWHRHPVQAPPDPALRIVWLHGWGQTGRSFERLAGLFAAKAETVVYDLPGFGGTPMLEEGAGTADYADALAAEMAEYIGETEKNLVVGHSYGARVAVQLAARHPERVDALVLIGGAGLKRRRRLAWRLRAGGLRLLGRLAKASDRVFGTDFRRAYAERFGSADYRRAGPLRATLVSAVSEDLAEQARQVAVPALLIYGREDSETPPELGERYAALMAEAELHVLEGYGHLDILSRGAFQCQALIDRFLARIA